MGDPLPLYFLGASLYIFSACIAPKSCLKLPLGVLGYDIGESVNQVLLLLSMKHIHHRRKLFRNDYSLGSWGGDQGRVKHHMRWSFNW